MPLASELRGEPGRLRVLMDAEAFSGRSCFLEGVLARLVELSDAFFFLAVFSLSEGGLTSSALIRSSSLRRSVSVSSDSLYNTVSMFNTQASL